MPCPFAFRVREEFEEVDRPIGGLVARGTRHAVLAALAGPREGRVWRAGKIRTAFESAVRKAAIGEFRFHDCRHHFASWFMMRGGSLPALQALLGHRAIQTTMIYAHLSPAHLRSEVAKTERPTVSTFSAQESVIAVESREGVDGTG